MSARTSNPLAKPAGSAESHDVATTRAHVRRSVILPALDAIGDQWVLRILRELFYGVRRFDHLRGALGIARSTLSSRLDDLVRDGLVEKAKYQDSPPRYEYALTRKGLDTAPVIFSIERWDRTWGPETDDQRHAVHDACGRPFEARLACGHCGGPVRARDVAYEANPGSVCAAAPGQRNTRRRSGPSAGGRSTGGAAAPPMTAADILGDRWTSLVLAAAWFGMRRFRDIEQAIEIAPNILSRRLTHLTACGIFARHIYQERPRRSQYILTEKGFDLYPVTVALLDWGNCWFTANGDPPLILVHKACGQPLDPVVQCAACGGAADPSTVSVPVG